MADPEIPAEIIPEMPAASDNETFVPPSIEIGGETQGEQKLSQVEEEHPLKEEVLTPPPPPPPQTLEAGLEEKNTNISPATQPPKFRNTMFQRALAIVKEEEETEKAAKLKEEEEKSPKETIVVVAPPAPEIRAAPYVTRPNPKILYKIDRELRDGKYYLVGKRVFGDPKAPDSCSFFVIDDLGKRYQVKIQQFPACQCGDFLQLRLCKHMMFVMLKFFKLKKYDPLNWQRAYLSTELRSLLSDPRITSSSKIEAKKKFVSKLFPPKVASIIPPDEPLGLEGPKKEPGKELGPQFCPICLEQLNFVAEMPKIPYIGPIPWKPKFMPKLDMAPPKSIQVMIDQKARLNNDMKKHEEEMAFAKQEEPKVETADASKEDLDGEKRVENQNKSGGEEENSTRTKSEDNGQGNNEGKTTIVIEGEEKDADKLDLSPPLQKYEPIWFCHDSNCKGDAACFKLVHEWCYKKFDNFGIYPRGKQCPVFSTL